MALQATLYLNLSNKTITQAKAVPTWHGNNKREMSKATLTNGSTPHQINVSLYNVGQTLDSNSCLFVVGSSDWILSGEYIRFCFVVMDTQSLLALSACMCSLGHPVFQPLVPYICKPLSMKLPKDRDICLPLFWHYWLSHMVHNTIWYNNSK